MNKNDKQRPNRRIRRVAAIAAGVWLLALLPWMVIPARAITLCGTTFTGIVDPTGGTTATKFVFKVTVTAGPTPTFVYVRLSGVWHGMTSAGGGVYTWTPPPNGTLAAGTYNYRFRV